MYKSAIKHNNSFAWYYYYLGTVLEKTSKTDEAVEAYKIAISMNPNSSSFHDSLKKLIDQ
jgi:tetratricopeptide (TPR) repeat protein